MGVLAYFLYNYGSMAIGAAYNNLFLVYVAIFSASLFGLVLSLMSFDVQALPAHFSAGLPRRGIAIFLIVSGVILALVWLVLSIVPALLQNTAPLEVASSTTFITRAKRSGMRWTPEGLDALLPVRTSVLNGAYDSLWQQEYAA